MTIAPQLAGVTFVALPDPPDWALVRSDHGVWVIYRDGAPYPNLATFESKARAKDQLNQMRAGWWEGWYRAELAHLALVAELDAAGA